MKVLLNSFHLNGHTLKLHPQVKISLYNITKERTVQYRHTQGLHSQAKSHPNQKADNLKVPLFDSFPFGCHSHEFIPVYRRKGLNVNLDNKTSSTTRRYCSIAAYFSKSFLSPWRQKGFPTFKCFSVTDIARCI